MGEVIYFHYSAIQKEGPKILNTGDKMTFGVELGPRGRRAKNLRAIERKAIEARG